MEEFVKWAIRNNWQVEISSIEQEIPKEAFCRYAMLPEDYMNFLKHIITLSDETDTGWFLNVDDFKGTNLDTEWQPCSFEDISIEAADGDDELIAEITVFWNEHIPIFFCLANGYEYYAIRLSDGSVVNGIEPEFEETSVVSASFKDFLKKIMTNDIVF